MATAVALTIFLSPPSASKASGGEGSGVGGMRRCRKLQFPPPRFAIASDCEPILPAASRGEVGCEPAL
jgi:hypothetical protein